MRFLLVILLAATCAAGLNIEEALELREQAALEDADEYLDDVVETLQEFAEDQGLDPLELPSRIGCFSVQVLLQTWHGEEELLDWIEDLVPANRAEGEDSFENSVLRVIDDVEFDDLLVSYFYLVKIMKVRSIGDVFGQVEELKITADIKQENSKYQPTYLHNIWFANIRNQDRLGTGGSKHSSAIYRLFTRLSRNISLQALFFTILQLLQFVMARISIAKKTTHS